MNLPLLTVVIPAAGIGKRMQSATAKQYLPLHNKTIIEHSISAFLDLPFVKAILVPLANNDSTFCNLAIAEHEKVITLEGGKERADSVLNGVKHAIDMKSEWVMVHDAARPCVSKDDIVNLYQTCIRQNSAGILASRVRDTMKRGDEKTSSQTVIKNTVERKQLWHGLTPQCAKAADLFSALTEQIGSEGLIDHKVTDEASALEMSGKSVLLVEGSAKNIKVTMPEDLELAGFYLNSSGTQ